MSTKNTSHYRYIVHKYLDAIWIIGSNKNKTRGIMYKWLANKLNIPVEESHVKLFTKAQCKEAIKILRPMYIQLYGHDIEWKGRNKKMNLKVTGTYIFETAHILPKSESQYDGLYSRTYKIRVTVEGPQEGPYSMIIPQEELKEAIKQIVPDRKFIFYKEDPVCNEIVQVLDKYNIPYLEFSKPVVAENLIAYIEPLLKNYIYDDLGYKNIKVTKIELSSIKDDYSVILEN